MKLTLKQKRFADEYIISGNATQSAMKAGYSEKTAYSIGVENLKKPEIKSYIEKRLDKANNAKLLTMQEALEITSDIARGKPMKQMDKIIYPNFADRQKALEHFYKIQGAFIEKREVSAEVENKSIFDNISTEDIKKLITDG